MPLTGFRCPDGKTRPTSACYDCPRPEGRCLSLPTLVSMAQTRIYKGIPSTTQLLNPTRLEYLQITKPYSVDPFDQAFALLGTRHHQKLEAVAKKLEGLEPEKYLKGETSGILDLLEPIGNTGTYRLIDYKTFGSYSVAKHLALKGDKGDYDVWKLALQINNYKRLVEDLGFNVAELKVQITVRDGGTFSAKNNKVERNLYLLPVDILPDDVVRDYFQSKAYALTKALETGETELCDYEERWGGRRCRIAKNGAVYCPVYKYCPEGAKVNNVEIIIS